MSIAAEPGSGTVLNVDDDLLGRFAITLLLRQAGFRVLEAGTVAEALRLTTQGPDLILLDVHLPDGNGMDVCRRLREAPATAAIPVIFLSAVAVRPEDRALGLSLGAADYLIKPIEPAVVVANVKAVLRIRQADRQADEARARLADAEKVLAQNDRLLAHLRDPLVVTDLQGVVISWNEGAARLFGRPAAEVVDRPLVELFREPDQETFRAALRASAGKVWEGDLEVGRPDGSRVWVEVHASRVEGVADGPDGIVWQVHDATRRKRLEGQYRQAQKMEVVGRLAGGLAHDFNDLLTVIAGYGDVLLSGLSPENPMRSMVHEMTKAGERAAALSHRLLAFSRRGRMAPRLLDLNAVVADLVPLFHWILGQDVVVRTRLQPNLGRVKADPGEIDQVIVTLAVHARDALPAGGTITLEARNIERAQSPANGRPGPHVLLVVRGAGPGTPEEGRERPPETLVAALEAGETELTLAAVHEAVQHAGGHIRYGVEPGRGAAFEVYLPRAPEAGREGLPQPDQTIAPGGPRTVLVAEDEEAVRSLVCLVLRRGGYVVLEASHPAEACRVAERHGGPIHLLLTDVVMPGGGGRQLAADLRALYPDLKVLFMSGYSEGEAGGKGLGEEAPFLQKPFTPAALAHKVREVLEAPPRP